MRITLPVNYGFFANASSLNLIPKKLFFEFGQIMNDTKSFTIAASMLDDIWVGNINQHYDCVSIPNMGGYMFPPKSVLASNNLFVGVVGIDEVVLGEEVFRTKKMWERSKPIINKEVNKWKTQVNKIKRIHVSTASDKNQLIEFFKIPEDKIDIIPYGVDHDLFKPPENKIQIRKIILSKFYLKERPYFIHISEVNWKRKNIIRILEAFKQAKVAGLLHYLIIVGKNDPIIFEMAKTIPDVIILGFIEEKELIQLIQGADALVNPSLHEGFGLPFVESMSCGVPVISSNVFSPPEVIADGGILIDPYNVSEISKALLEISKNEKLRHDLSEQALKRSQFFSWDKTAKKLLKMFQKYVTIENETNFDENYNSAAMRTIVTTCRIHPGLTHTLNDLGKFNFSRIIPWLIEVGLDDPLIKYYVFPFKKWIEEHSK